MIPRIFVPQPFHPGEPLVLPPGPSRHVQVLRLQPGAPLVLFNGDGGEWAATVTRMGRADVEVALGLHDPVERELTCRVTIAVGMPANERMDTLVEKATELGVFAIQPLVCERSVLRLAADRALKKQEHWRGVAVAASEQCGRTRVPQVLPVMALRQWLPSVAFDGRKSVLSLREAVPFNAGASGGDMLFLSGPEGGLSEAEESAAVDAGFAAVTLGPRTLRADTAPLAVLAALALASA